eukprot:TRINITY_DN3056_c0_g1_i11.p1 TRINITY_DN3056_c0_g1~~TRINITY_DN3056_c0_g1_i11.p1  ORF type:complete len:172 (-),score=23.46 TRINITY_DN3056_c0_g1_i11:206-721(-)
MKGWSKWLVDMVTVLLLQRMVSYTVGISTINVNWDWATGSMKVHLNWSNAFTVVVLRSFHSLSLSESGDVYTWGSSEYGQQCGSNQYTDWQAGDHHKFGERKYFFSVPRKIEGTFDNEKVIKIGCGELYNVALTESGSDYTWDWDIHGELGHGNRGYQHSCGYHTSGKWST